MRQCCRYDVHSRCTLGAPSLMLLYFRHPLEDSTDTKMQDSQSAAKKRLMRGPTQTIKWLVGIALVALIVAGFVLTSLPKISCPSPKSSP